MTAVASDIPELASFIDGEWRQGPRHTPDTNPTHPAETVANTAVADAALAADAVAAAREAFGAWRTTTVTARGEILRKAGDLLDARAEQIGRDLTREEGKTLDEAVRETRLAASIFRYYAVQALDPDGETYPSGRPNLFLYTKREPIGVVSVITPWNFPACIPAWKVAPALAFGDTVVWKPADLVPLTAVHILQALLDAGLPAGVVNLVLGRGSEIGDVLTTHADVSAVTFTGSNAVGRALQAKAAAKGKKVQLELGGKNPAIVLADADLDFAAEQVARGAFMAAGQKCTATSRVIVDRGVAAELIDRLNARAEEWTVGDPLDPQTKIGPIVSSAQLESVLRYLDQARRDGARSSAGGARAGGALADGYFVQPTVFVDVAPEHTIAREEIFGPVAAILPVGSYEEAVALANDTPYGLSASIFTNDLAKAHRFAQDIRAGVVKVNQETAGIEYHVPFGGVKESSSGSREQGKAAREFFTESKTVYLSFPTSSA
ncbi:MAG TPA: aldehyde dehydrogenase family protein [Candidatus Limnocylindria bacterium]